MSEHKHTPVDEPFLPDALQIAHPDLSDAPASDFDQIEETVRDALPPSPTTQQDLDIFLPLDGAWDEQGTFVVGMTDTRDRTVQALDNMPNINLEEHEAGREFVGIMTEALDNAPKNNQWRRSVDRYGTHWRQYVESERDKLAMGQVKFNTIGEGENLTVSVRSFRCARF